jgi:PleD family two-component response regulator
MNELFHSADVSLYEAKNAGRNLVRLHQDRVPSRATEANAP